jgi:hypothetical protein
MDLYSPYLRFSTAEPGVFASPGFIDAARQAGATVVDVYPQDLAATVEMARATRGQPPTIGAVTLQLTNEQWRARPSFQPIPTDRVLGATDPVRLNDIEYAARNQKVEVLQISTGGLDHDALQQATY